MVATVTVSYSARMPSYVAIRFFLVMSLCSETAKTARVSSSVAGGSGEGLLIQFSEWIDDWSRSAENAGELKMIPRHIKTNNLIVRLTFFWLVCQLYCVITMSI